MRKATVLSCVFLFFMSIAQAQFEAFQQKTARYDSLFNFDGRERLFVHYDKPQYTLNDTLWMKGYLVAGALNTVNDSSRIAYIELIDASGNLVKRISALCSLGLFYSNITLGDQLFTQGLYTLRAYTNRMRNFGDSLFFVSTIKIIDPKASLWKATLNDLSFSNNQLFISAGLKADNNQPIANSRVEVAMKSGRKTVFKRRMITDANGNIYIDTLLKDPKAVKNLRLEITNKQLQLQIPVPVQNQPVDLQFLPEGGSLLTGHPQRLGFKAVDMYGKGAPVAGVIKNSKGSIILSFAAVHHGMGYVWLTPQAGETYTAFLDNGSQYPLPAAQASGCLLHADYNATKDSIVVKATISPDQAGSVFFITGSSRGSSYIKGMLRNKSQYTIKVAANNFPGGVARFTLYNQAGIPVNEQAIFVWHNDALRMALQADKPEYFNKDSVGLSLSVKYKDNERVPGSFSISVIDTSQVGITEDGENILSYMLLSSELKGKVEAPYYYIRHPHSQATKALMLTQGWVRYSFNDTPKKYAYEKEFSINGKVTNVLNKPSPQTKVTLFGRQGQHGIFLMDTVTNSDGTFSFTNFPVFATDSVSTLIQAVNKRDKSFGVGIDVAAKDYPAIPEDAVAYDANSIVFDTAVKKAIDRRTLVIEQLKRDGRYLEEVVVTAKARIPDSKNLNEDGGSDQTITQAVLEQTPKASLLNVLAKQFPGFPVARGAPFRIGKSAIYIVIDGMDLAFFEMNPYDVLQYYSAEDVKGIEIMRTMGYVSPYVSRFLNPMEVDMLTPPIFIEITTHGGVGPFLKKIPGMYLLKPVAPFIGKEFYSPRYASPDEEPVFPDLRQTVYWNPGVVTDENGEAKISFYTSESKGSYLIIVQGTDLKGNFGTLMMPLVVKPEQ